MSTIPLTPSLTGTWSIDPVHSRIGFNAKHLGINIVKGRFETFEGTIEIPNDLGSLSTSGVIDAASVTTHFAMRDEHLRSAEFLDVENHPRISFRSTGVTPLGEDSAEVTGAITIRGVTQPLRLTVEARGIATDQFGHERLGLHATGELQRSDFAMPYDERVAGIPIVAETIQLELDIEATKQD
jgi:polyisoprenoid-binding protein YceI